MIYANFNLIAGIAIFGAVVLFVYLLLSVQEEKVIGKTLISEDEKRRRITDSVRSMLSSSELNDIAHAQMLIEGMCKDDPVWLIQVLGDFRNTTPTWMLKAPHRKRILTWARGKLSS